MPFSISLLIILITFFIMEGVAWMTHKYVMHGFLWNLHEDHHMPNHDHFFEKNDSFFLVFAVPSFLLCFFGSQAGFNWMFFVGVGIAVYGAAYFFVHEIFIHQRIKFLRNSNNVYFRAIRKAHKVHHKHLGKEDGECFGMLWVPMKYFREAIRSSKK
jgi:beta-carotene 3-hydroxylase